MADDWSELPFSQAVTLNPSVQLARGTVYPFVDMGAVSPGSRSVHAREEREFKGSGARFVSGDTLMARITPCLENGKIARFLGDPEQIAHGSTEFIVIRGRDGITDTEYAYYLTQWEGVRDYAISQMTGSSGRQRVPAKALEYLHVPLPPVPEQLAIAHILGTLDDKIELNRRMSETLETMARALFKSWFVDFDPVRAKSKGRDPGLPQNLADLFPDRLVDSELGEIPEGWEVGMFGDVVELLRDSENPLDSPDVEFRHFSIPAFDDGHWPKREFGKNIKSLKSRVPPGVVLLSKLNPEIERVWLVDAEQGARAICSTEFLVLAPRAPHGRAFVYCLARSPLFRQELEGLVTGTSKSHQRAQAGSILGLAVATPPASLLSKFEVAVEPLLAQSLGCRRESRTLATLRDALLPRLISGELRVRDVDHILVSVA